MCILSNQEESINQNTYIVNPIARIDARISMMSIIGLSHDRSKYKAKAACATQACRTIHSCEESVDSVLEFDSSDEE